MPARLGYPYLYHQVTAGLSDSDRDHIDAVLGDEGAHARVNQANLDVLRAAGGGGLG